MCGSSFRLVNAKVKIWNSILHKFTAFSFWWVVREKLNLYASTLKTTETCENMIHKKPKWFFLCFYFAFFYLLYHLIWVMTFTWWCIKQQKRLCYTRCGVEMENGFDSVRVMIEALFFHSEFSLESLHSCFSFFRYQLATYTIIIYVCICLEASLSSSSWHEWEREAHCAAHS